MMKTKDRAELKAYFLKNAIPTQTDFSDLIDGMLNQEDDGVTKRPGDPLSIEASGDGASAQRVLNLYRNLEDGKAAWTVSLQPRATDGSEEVPHPGLGFTDGQDQHRLFIEEASGHVGVGTVKPAGFHVSLPEAGTGGDVPAGVLMSGGPTGNAKIELRNSGSGTPYIDFTQDPSRNFDARLRLTSPDTLNVEGARLGIGVTKPERELVVGGDAEIGLGNDVTKDRQNGVYWHKGDGYAITRTPGAWNGPNYQQLMIRWHTGIVLEPGRNANGDYGRSFVEIRNSKGLMLTHGRIGVGTTAPKDAIDVHGGISFGGDTRRRITGEVRDGQHAVVLRGNWNELEVKGRVIDWTGSNLHIGYERDYGRDGIIFGKVAHVTLNAKSELRVPGSLKVGGASSIKKIIAGRVNSNGTRSLGSNFTCSRQSKGVYTVTFNPAFTATPVFVCTSTDSDDDNTLSVTMNARSATVWIHDAGPDKNADPEDGSFSFIAMEV